jgi:hypothetical protein
MDADTSDDPWPGYYRPVVTQHPVVVDGRTYIVEETSYEPLSYEAEQERISRLMLPYLLNRPESNRSRPDPSESNCSRPDSPESNRSVKRARLAASSDAVLGLQEARPGDAGVRTPAECAVCLQDFVAEDRLRVMPCSHTFHQDCIFRWLRMNHVCPLCRHALPTQAQPVDDDDGNYQEERMVLPEQA